MFFQLVLVLRVEDLSACTTHVGNSCSRPRTVRWECVVHTLETLCSGPRTVRQECVYYTHWKLVFRTQNSETGVCVLHTGNLCSGPRAVRHECVYYTHWKLVFRAQNCETGVCVLHTLETCVQDPEL